MNEQVDSGLENVVVARTEVSEVNGQEGTLLIRGYPIERLTGQVAFEDVVGLLVERRLPGATTGADPCARLGVERLRAAASVRAMGSLLDAQEPMSAVRSALSLLPSGAGVAELLATAAVTVAWAHQARRGRELIEPDPGLGHAHDLLRLTLGREVTTREAALLDAYLVTVAEHGFNASTFVARVVASTGADLVSAVVAGVGALSGPLHGGAPGPVLDLLDQVGEPARAHSVVCAELDAGRRLMGMGHRVYRVRDPRAYVLERAIREFEAGADSERLALARAVEAAAESELARRHPKRALRANVEFYTAVLLDALGLPRQLFTAIFACARIAGYAAHVLEQRATGRLIRPSALYVGPRDSTGTAATSISAA